MTEYREYREHIYQSEGRGYPGKALVELELRPGFDTAKRHYIQQMRKANEAQLIMLAEQKIISPEEARKLLRVVEETDYERYKTMEYTGEFEDLFFQLESDMMKASDGLAGDIHLARSRNDLSLALDHLTVRDVLLGTIKRVTEFQNTVRMFAEEHKETLFVAQTHTQDAQPSVFGHYFLGVFDVLDRDLERLWLAYEKTNASPLGAAAITTSGFPVNRARVAELCGFTSVIENSFDAIGDVDYNIDTAQAVIRIAVDLSRVVSDLLLWATEPVSMIKVSEGYISTSSIMPQKRNPIALEHLRASLGMVKGLSEAVLEGYYRSPYGDISDHEDIVPLMVQALSLFDKDIELFNAVMATLDVDKALMSSRAFSSFAVVTEMADTIVRETSIPFRKAHAIVTRCVKEALAQGKALHGITDSLFQKEYLAVVGEKCSCGFERIAVSLNPEQFVQIRNVYGGVGPEAMSAMLVSAQHKHEKRLLQIDEEETRLDAVEHQRKQTILQMLQ
jgi:argininosuccinate lyase